MKNFFFLVLLVIVSCKTPIITKTTIYGVLESKSDKSWPEINFDKKKVNIDDAKADKYVGRYVKAEGYLSDRHVHFIGRGSEFSYRMEYVKFTVVKDCDNILTILNFPEFEKQFQISKKPTDSVTIYLCNYGDLDRATLCNDLKTNTGKTIHFAVAHFEPKIYEGRRDVPYPYIVISKIKGRYYFVDLDTNASFDAAVKNGKVKKDYSLGAF